MIEEKIWGSKKELKEVIDRQIDTIIGEIYGLFFSASDPDDVSFHDILNRIMLLLQAPITFVLCKKNKNTNTKEIYRFNSHPFHQSNISKALNEAKIANQLFSLFETKESINDDDRYYLLVLLVENHDTEPTRQAKFTPLSPNNNNNKDYYILVYKLLKILDGNLYEERFKSFFLEQLKYVLKKYDNLKDLEKKEFFNRNGVSNEDRFEYKEEYKRFEQSLKKDSNEYQLLHHGVIDKVYKKSRGSLLLYRNKSCEKPLANFILFMREFDGTRRCDDEEKSGYNYNLRIVICSEQENDIKNYLQWLKENKGNYRNWYVDKNFPEENKSKNLYYNLAIQINDHFWDLIDNGNIQYIIDIIGHPFGKTAYSMADPIFENSIINFRNSSVNAGIHRAYKFKDEEELKNFNYKSLKDGEVKKDLFRIVALHYLMMGMANNPNNFIVMLAPLEIGGRIPAVIGYVTSHTNSLKQPSYFSSEDITNFSTNWRNCFHIYSDLYSKRLKRDMRSYFWLLYIKTITKICADAVDADIEKRKNTIPMNKRLEFLTKFFSFSGISVSLRLDRDKNIKEENVAIYSPKYNLELSDEPSSFPSASGRIVKLGKFIDHYEIVSRINTALSTKYNP